MSLSVLIPNYNHGAYLSRALEAIINQSLKPMEVIIVDDASKDHSLAIIESYQKKYPFIHLYRNEQNQGAVHALNQALDLAKGKYVACCASDDEILPGFFELSLDLLKKYPQSGFCSSKYCFFYEENSQNYVRPSGLSKDPSYLSPSDFFKSLKVNDIRLGGQNTIFDREKLIAAGKFLPQMRFLCDWFAISVLGFRYGACFLPEPLTRLRIHQKSFSQSHLDKKNLVSLLKTLETLLSDSSFADVRKSFLRSGLVYQLGLHYHPIYFRKKYWKFITPAWIFRSSVDLLKNCKHRLTCRF